MRTNTRNKKYYTSPEEVRMEYFQWLCGLVDLDRGYWILAKDLHEKEFYWSVSNDDNRAADGQKLREIFLDETLYTDDECLDGPCSLLEMMVGLAIRMNDILCDPEDEECDFILESFWNMIDNLGLREFSDINYSNAGGEYEVDEILTALLERNYKRSGEGGLFPLKSSRKDQRKVEIWYQMSSYLLENYNN